MIALVTCQNLPEPDPDLEPLTAACEKAGVEVEFPAWDDPKVDWSRYGIAVLHSTWNYYRAPDAFLEWLRRASEATRVFNPPDLVSWNIDKRYLLELAAKGVPVIPTRILNNAAEIASTIAETRWDRFVIKPTISASSYMTRVFGRDDGGQATDFAKAFAGKPFMVQQFMSRVEDAGEIALVHIDGQLTHGVIKSPRFDGHEESVSAAVQPTPEQAQAASAVMAKVDLPWIYGRVDLMLSDDGDWLLSELELIEPSLFLLQYPPAMDRFVVALKRL